MDDLLSPLFKLVNSDHVFGMPGGAEVWVGGRSILAVKPNASGSEFDSPTINCSGMSILPGLVDLNVHVTGDCGLGGYTDRTPEAGLPCLLNAGITTFVGVLGPDTCSRNPMGVLAKVRGLARAGGISGFMCTGTDFDAFMLIT